MSSSFSSSNNTTSGSASTTRAAAGKKKLWSASSLLARETRDVLSEIHDEHASALSVEAARLAELRSEKEERRTTSQAIRGSSGEDEEVGSIMQDGNYTSAEKRNTGGGETRVSSAVSSLAGRDDGLSSQQNGPSANKFEDDVDADASNERERMLLASGDPELIVLERELEARMQQCPRRFGGAEAGTDSPSPSRIRKSSDNYGGDVAGRSSSTAGHLLSSSTASNSIGGLLVSSSSSATNSVKDHMKARTSSSSTTTITKSSSNKKKIDLRMEELLRTTDAAFELLPPAPATEDIEAEVDALAGLRLDMQILESVLGDASGEDHATTKDSNSTGVGGSTKTASDLLLLGGATATAPAPSASVPPLSQPHLEDSVTTDSLTTDSVTGMNTSSSSTYVEDAATQLLRDELECMELEWKALKEKQRRMASTVDQADEMLLKATTSSSNFMPADRLEALRKESEELKRRVFGSSQRRTLSTTAVDRVLSAIEGG
ncbi:unnamed protein product [Amoebophrya sp. A25]|nr:unnamed protein product [Amoebophrya sp. A25]|eukprot:GSA25T00019294001.1